jgi:predicted membrane-bound spermidine synthase
MTYHVLPIGITVLVIYLFSLYLSHTGFTARHAHRRFWNWVLLCSFIVTGLFGLFLALKISYRWDIKFSDALLNWHVEAGIAMALSAVIHLTWHFGYYFHMGKAKGGMVPQQTVISRYKRNIRLLLMLTGFISSSSQFILIREAVILGGGSEASAAVFLWLWLTIAATGAVSANRSVITDTRRMIWTLLAGTAIAPVMFILMNWLLLNPGETPSLLQMVVILSVSVAPVTFISSLVFMRFSAIRQSEAGSPPGGSFGLETAGSVAAGVITAMSVTVHLGNYELYILILLISSVIAISLLGYHKRLMITALSALIPLGAIVILTDPDVTARDIVLRGVTAVKSTDTPFGNITSGVYSGEQTIFYDHRPLFFSGDIISSEENIHYALLQRKSYEKVILISGGLRKHLPQLMKHDIAELVYLEYDPGIISAEGVHDTVTGNMMVTVKKTDPLAFMRRDKNMYDAVIQLIPPPSALSVNRFYTVEYFRMVMEHLSADGIFMCTPMPYYNYSPVSYRKSFSPIYNALKDVFSNVELIPGSSLYAIASRVIVTADVAGLADRRKIDNSYVNSDYLNDDEIRMREEQILEQIDVNAGVNSALRPVSSLFANVLSLEGMGTRGGIIAIMAVLLLIPFLFISRGGVMMFSSSAGLAGFGMIMIFILQITVGNLYLLSAVILALLMAGLAAGAAWGQFLALRKLSVCTMILTALYLVAGFLAPELVTALPIVVITVILVLLPVAGFVTGAVYRILTKSGIKGITGSVYASDLAGAALGYLTVATVLVPLAGTANACFILATMILVSGIVASMMIKH